ncbi:MAG: hypothetical protein ACRD3J_25970 [Thermoanaerobaculia bacterium]
MKKTTLIFHSSLFTLHSSMYSSPPMDEPEYLICLQCETPTYQFEFANGKLAAAICNTCGADDLSDFMTESELEEMSGH